MAQTVVGRMLSGDEVQELIFLKRANPGKVVWGCINPDNDNFKAHVDLDNSLMWLAATIGFQVYNVQEEL